MAEPLWTIPEIAAALETSPIWPTHRPSPQPSPHGRGSSVEAVAASFPLPEGEGQGEGLSRSDFRQTLPSIPISGVSIDSRTLKHGDLFFAIKGERMDGHKFIAGAFDKGAAGAVVEQGFEPPSSSCVPLFRMPDTLEAMNALARQSRKRSQARIVAVTGSVGKTGTKEMLRTMLSASGVTHASEKSYNNLWGVPLSLARMPKEAAFGVFEIGMNHAGEITPLTRLVRPDIAIVTWVAPVHIEFFNSVAEIADAKAEIFDGFEQGGIAILPADNEHFARLAARARAKGARCRVVRTER